MANPFESGGEDANPFKSVDDYNPFGAQSAPRSASPQPTADEAHETIFGSAPRENDGFTATRSPASGYGGNDGSLIQPDPSLHEIKIGEPAPGFGYDNGPGDGKVPPFLEPMQREDLEQVNDYSFWQLGYYQTLFNVNTTDVLDRIFRATVPFRRNFFPTIKPNPDLYGLVWVCATLVFVTAASGNFSNYIVHQINNTPDWSYDFIKLPYSAATIYAYNVIIPLALWGVLTWIDDFDLTLSQMLCLYSYSMFIFIPAAIVSAIPSLVARLVGCGLACAISILHLLISLGPQLVLRRKVALILLLVVAALHVGLTLSFVLYFFSAPGIEIIPQAPIAPPVVAPVTTPA